MTDEIQIIVCRTCGQKNRVPIERGIARCGNCRTVLKHLPIFARIARLSTWFSFFPLSVLGICFSSLLLMWIGELVWWISLPVVILLLPLPALSAFWPSSTTPNPKIAAMILAVFWVAVETFVLFTKGLTLPWNQNVIRFLIDTAILIGAGVAFRKGKHNQ
jgi:hypothetical protein